MGYYFDNNNAPIGLTTSTPGGLGYEVAEIENHLHSSGQIYGLTSNTMARKSTSAIVVTGGNGAWGTELEIHNGATIESGSATKKFDLHEMYVSAVGTSNRVTILEWYYGTRDAGQIACYLNTGDTISKRSAAVAATTQEAGDTITPTGAVPANDTRVVLDTIVTSTNISNDVIYYVVNAAATTFQISTSSGGAAVDIQTGDGTCNFSIVTAHGLTDGTKIALDGAGLPAAWNNYTTYYVVGATALTFQVSLTLGGAAVTCASAGQLTYYVLTQTLFTEQVVSRASTTSDTFPIMMQSSRVFCNQRVWCRGWAAGGTNAISFHLGLHTYAA